MILAQAIRKASKQGLICSCQCITQALIAFVPEQQIQPLCNRCRFGQCRRSLQKVSQERLIGCC